MESQQDVMCTKVTAQSQLRETATTAAAATAKLDAVATRAHAAPGDLAEAAAIRTSLEGILANALSIEAELSARGAQLDFSPDLERCRLDARTSLETATILYERVVRAAQSSGAESAALEGIARELLDARDFHRERGRQLFVVVCAVVPMSAVLIAFAFLLFDPRSGAWATGIGRAALILLVAWVVRFATQAQARSAELAIWYQDRRVAIRTAGLLLESDATEVRDAMLQHMLSAYGGVGGPTGASATPAGPITSRRRDLGRLVTLVRPERSPLPSTAPPN